MRGVTHWANWEPADLSQPIGDPIIDADLEPKPGQPPRLIPLFPVDPGMTPQSPCGHKRPIKRGSVFVCMVCHQSGWDGHPALVIGPGEMPASEEPDGEPKRRLGPKLKPSEKLTRKERRALEFGHTESELASVQPSDDASADDTAPSAA